MAGVVTSHMRHVLDAIPHSGYVTGGRATGMGVTERLDGHASIPTSPSRSFQIMGQLLHGRMQDDIRIAWQRRMQEQSPVVDIYNQAQLIRHFQRRFGRRGEERSGLVVEMNWICVFVQREFPV